MSSIQTINVCILGKTGQFFWLKGMWDNEVSKIRGANKWRMKGGRKMPDKAGDRFTDIKGINYVLRPDPRGGHLRPVTENGTSNNWLAAILALVITTVVVGGSRWIWNKITKKEN
jgi:hypothetical protein